ncbi:MAG: AIR carboxylase family protein, partial [Thermoproteota archaeon]
LLSIVQMPPGIPVATVGVDNWKNAAILAVEILALKHPSLTDKLLEERKKR